MKNQLILLLLLIPAVGFTQHLTIVDLGHGKVMKRDMAPSFSKILDVQYFLLGTREDTFATQNAQWSSADSSKLYYNNADSSLVSLIQMVNDVDSGWVFSVSTYYYFDENKLDTAEVIQSWDEGNSSWFNQSKFSFDFDASQNLITTIVRNWNAGNYWENANQVANSYDVNNNLLETNLLSWNGSAWDSLQRFVYAYDANNNRIEEIDYIFSGIAWDPISRYLTSYNLANLDTQVIALYWNGSNWKNDFQDTLVYDGNDNLLTFERYDWQQSTGAFDLTMAKVVYSYDANNNVIERYNYNGNGIDFLPSVHYTYQYDADDNNIYQLIELYNTINAAYEFYSRKYFYYSDQLPVGIAALNEDAFAIKLYPNPAQHNLYYEIHADLETKWNVQLADVSGRILMNQDIFLHACENQFTIDISPLPSGIYYLSAGNSLQAIRLAKSFVRQ